MDRNDLYKLIQAEIQAVAFDYLKEKTQKEKATATSDYLASKSITDEDIDHALFHGGGAPREEDKYKGKITIKEGVDTNLKITTSEIKNFENSFKQILDNVPGASIVFDKQKNNYSIIATKRPDGVEAKASGILNLGENGKIIWSYSILNGLILNAQNLKLNQSNKGMFEAFYNHYDDWQKKWREKLNLPNAAVDSNDSEMDNTKANMPPLNQSAPPVSGPTDSAPSL